MSDLLSAESLGSVATPPSEAPWQLGMAVQQENWDEALKIWTRIERAGGGAAEDFARAAMALRRLGRFDTAEAVIGKGLQRTPDHPELLVDHAWLALERGQVDEAEQRWQTVMARLPDEPTGPVGMGVTLLRLGRHDAAEAVFAAAQPRFPNHKPLLLEWAQAAHRRGDWAEAVQRWEIALWRGVNPGQVVARLVAALREAGRLDEAEAVASSGAAGPASASLLAEHALVAHARADWAAAAQRWQAVRAASDDLTKLCKAYVLGAWALQHSGRAEAAEALLAEGVARLPQEAELWTAWGQQACNRGDLTEALRRWGESMARQPGAPDGYVGSAHALRELGRIAEAEAVLAPALELFPDNFFVLAEHARTGELLHDHTERIQRWAAVRTRFPDNPLGHARSAEACRAAGLLEEAAALAEVAASRFPDDVGAVLAQAYLARARHGPTAALACWERAHARFPEHPAVHAGLVTALTDVGQFEAAERVASPALARWPQVRELRAASAQVATGRGNHAEAVRRWKAMRADFPDAIEVYTGLVTALQDAGRFAEADAELAEVLQSATRATLAGTPPGEGSVCHPREAELWSAWARLAQDRGDLAEAARRWGELSACLPGAPDGYLGSAYTLRALGRIADAEAALAPALELFPNNFFVLAEHAWTGERLGDQTERMRRWDVVRTRFPDNPLGHVRVAETCREAGRLAEAMTLAEAAAIRFPDDVGAALVQAYLTRAQRGLAAALACWERAHARFPEDPAVLTGLVEALGDAEQYEAAEEIAVAAAQRWPRARELRAACAFVATRRGDHTEAVQRWQALRADFPNVIAVYPGLAAALCDAGRFAEAETVLAEALRHNPDDIELARQQAITVTAARDWSRALPLWQTLLRRAPDSRAVRVAVHDAAARARLDEGAGELPAATDTVPSALLTDLLAQAPVGDGADTGALLMRFESLGDTCEFGILQRQFEVEPLSLLRWATVHPKPLLAALRERFAGIGEPHQTELAVAAGDYALRDTRYRFWFATFVRETQEPRSTFFPQQCQRMQFLRRALIQTIESGESILVYKYDPATDDGMLWAMRAAVRTYNPRTMLLGVRLEDSGHPSGSIDVLGDGLVAGYVDRFSNTDVSVDAWLSICRQTAALHQTS